MQIINGREVFSGDVSTTGGFYIGRQWITTQVTFNGTSSGLVPRFLCSCRRHCGQIADQAHRQVQGCGLPFDVSLLSYSASYGSSKT